MRSCTVYSGAAAKHPNQLQNNTSMHSTLICLTHLCTTRLSCCLELQSHRRMDFTKNETEKCPGVVWVHCWSVWQSDGGHLGGRRHPAKCFAESQPHLSLAATDAVADLFLPAGRLDSLSAEQWKTEFVRLAQQAHFPPIKNTSANCWSEIAPHSRWIMEHVEEIGVLYKWACFCMK